jgi:hypothetical protein
MRLARSSRKCLVLTACYVGLGVFLLSYHFVGSTQAYTSNLPPAGLNGLVAVAWLISVPVWVVVPVPLLLAGRAHLRRATSLRRRWPVAWVSVVAASAALEGLIIYHLVTYVGPGFAVSPPSADWDWSAVPQAIGLLVFGTAMIWLQTLAEQPAIGANKT